MKKHRAILQFSFLLLLIFIFSSKVSAQRNDVQLFTNNNTLRSTENNVNKELQYYLYDHLKSGVIENGNLKFTNPNFKRLYMDVASITSISNFDLSSVESIIIKVKSLNDLNTTVNYSKTFSSITNLKCIYIDCEIETTKQQVESMFTNVPSTNILNYFGINIPQ